MSIEKMELVNIAGLLKDLDNVLLKCCDSECFHIETALHSIDAKRGFKVLKEDNPYQNVLKKIYSLSNLLSYRPQKADFSSFESDTPDELEDYINSIDVKFKTLNSDIKNLTQDISQRENAASLLKHLQGINVDYERIFSLKHTSVRFGKLPIGNYQKLSYYDEKPFVFFAYDKDKEYYWGIYFVPYQSREIVDDIFESLFFERIRVPDFVHGTGQAAAEENLSVLAKENQELKEKKEELKKLLAENKKNINTVFSKIKFLNDSFELRKNASVINGKFYIAGFIPAKSIKFFMRLFDNLSDVSVLLSPPDTDSRLEPPSKLKNNRFAQPFSMFVEMYGLPSYHGFNPTTFVALTYTLLFGIMFGDLGQGLVIAIVGFIIYKLKKNAIGQILTRIGISSAIFGLLYGSVFGFEEALNPLYMLFGLKEKPLEVFKSTNTVLIGAIAIGVCLIIVSICLNIIIKLKQRDYEKALFGNNGVTGLVFYASVLVGGVSTIVLKHNLFTPLYIIFLIVLPLLIMFFRVPLGKLLSRSAHTEESEGGIGTFIAENFFELFEFLLGYVTNTMSFLRVGGFVLSHAGMMRVVMTLAEGASKGAAPIILIIGNIFVMCMEGMIVGIQVLRLEFYEIFSRFYEGDGHAFEPIKIDFDAEVK